MLFDAPGVPPQQIGPNVQTPASSAQSNPLPAIVIGGGLTMGMLLIGLVSVGGFTVLAQRRLRSFGVLASFGATEENISLVVKANGAVVGVVGSCRRGGAGPIGLGRLPPHVPSHCPSFDPVNGRALAGGGGRHGPGRAGCLFLRLAPGACRGPGAGAGRSLRSAVAPAPGPPLGTAWPRLPRGRLPVDRLRGEPDHLGP